MSDKLAVILVSADRKVLEMGLIYAKNVALNGWMSALKVYLFGPSEVTIATDPDLHAIVHEIVEGGTIPQACQWCSDKYGVSEKLAALGIEVAYIGAPVSEAIKAGYTPMTW
ncbi:MAG: hypothetical protein ACYC5M_01100 [Anaerolineae bacterium]